MPNLLSTCYFFGTFNPVHMGHLAMAQAVLAQKPQIKSVLFVPAGLPPHRHPNGLLPAQDRLKLVSMAIADNPFFKVSGFETGKISPCYTIETLEALEPEGFKPKAARIPLLMGADTVETLPTWHQHDRLLAHVHIFQVLRPESLVNFVPPSHEILLMPPLAISATWIRQQFLNGKPDDCRYLLPKGVLGYLKANQSNRYWAEAGT